MGHGALRSPWVGKRLRQRPVIGGWPLSPDCQPWIGKFSIVSCVNRTYRCIFRSSAKRRSVSGGIMRSERDKMLSGELYDPLDPQLSAERRRARLLCKALNDTRDDQQEERARLLKELIPAAGR